MKNASLLLTVFVIFFGAYGMVEGAFNKVKKPSQKNARINVQNEGLVDDLKNGFRKIVNTGKTGAHQHSTPRVSSEHANDHYYESKPVVIGGSSIGEGNPDYRYYRPDRQTRKKMHQEIRETRQEKRERIKEIKEETYWTWMDANGNESRPRKPRQRSQENMNDHDHSKSNSKFVSNGGHTNYGHDARFEDQYKTGYRDGYNAGQGASYSGDQASGYSRGGRKTTSTHHYLNP